MDNTLQLYTTNEQFAAIIEATLNGVGRGSRPVYVGAINKYLAWVPENPYPNVYASLIAYRNTMEENGLQASTINRRMSALRAFFKTAYNMGSIDEPTYRQIREVKNIPIQGQKHGRWLSLEQVRCLLAQPKVATLRGVRDRTILAFLLGCGLRRSEVVHLTWNHIQLVGGSGSVWQIENLLGKHNRTRSIPMQTWVVEYLFAYKHSLEVLSGSINPNAHIFFSIDRHGNWGEVLTDQSVWLIVRQYAKDCGVEQLAPHDLRRTYTKLLRQAGGELEEIQQMLGHSSLAVTQRYLGTEIDVERVSQLIDLGG